MDKHKYKYKYEYSYSFGQYPLHIWSCVGSKGAIHVHITDYGEEHALKYGEQYAGGIEFHYRHPPDYMDTAPTRNNCWLLNSPCWHDGSSLQASEYWIPQWELDPHNHEAMFNLIERRMEQKFTSNPEQEVDHDRD